MKNKLEGFVKDNKKQFEVKGPSDKLWAKIEAELDKQEKPKKSIKLYQWMSIAAMLVISLGVYFTYNYKQANNIDVADINPDGSSSPRLLTNVNGTLFFVTGNMVMFGPPSVYKLQKLKETPSGSIVETLMESGYIENLFAMDSTLYFSALDSTKGNELWKTDGTVAGTILLKDINLSGSSAPSGFTNVNDT
ncbi:MAG: hypothetical protein EOO43_26740, partial [Flavobacterium sp.]